MISKSIAEKVAKRVEDVAHTFALDEVRYHSDDQSKRYSIRTADGTLEVECEEHPLADFLCDRTVRGCKRDPSKYRIRFSGTDLMKEVIPSDFAASVFRQVDGRYAELSQLVEQRVTGFAADLISNHGRISELRWEPAELPGGEAWRGRNAAFQVEVAKRELGLVLGVPVAEYVVRISLADSSRTLTGDEALVIFEAVQKYLAENTQA